MHTTHDDRQGTVTSTPVTYEPARHGRLAFVGAPPATPWTVTLTAGAPRGESVTFVQTVSSGVADVIFEDSGTGEIGRLTAGGNGGSITFTSTGSQWLATNWSGDGDITI